MTDAPIPRSSSGSDELIDWLNDQIRFHGTSAAANDPAIQGHIAFLQRAIARLNGVAQRSGWQPIETAPRDGTEILGVFHRRYDEKDPPTIYGPWTLAWDGRKWRSSWDGNSVIEYQDDFGIQYKGPDIDPTHWQPIPTVSIPSTQRCTWPNCDQPSGHDYCYSHCLADRGAAVASTDGKSL